MLGNYGALSPSVSCLSVSWGVPDMLGGHPLKGEVWDGSLGCP